MVALLASLPGTHAAAQARVDQLALPRSVADTVIDFFNRPSTIRFTGRVEIPAGRVVVGDVAVLGGPVTIAGEVEGDLVVVNGNLTMTEDGTVTGNVTVLGGIAHTLDKSVWGQLAVYEQELSYRQRGNQITYDEHRWDRWRGRRDLSHISVRVEQNYNRVEGLPVMFGPVFQTSGKNYFRMDALAIWRSQSGPHLASNDLGYLVRGEQHFGPGGRYSVGASVRSMVQPIESWKLTNVEASLATFLLHEDFRDYYRRKGFGAFLRYDHPSAGVHLTVEYRSEDQGFLTAVSPWTLRRNAEPWRPQPLVGEGRIGTMTGQLVLDSRNDREDPTDGWYLQASSTFGVGGTLTLPEYLQPEPAAATVAAAASRWVSSTCAATPVSAPIRTSACAASSPAPWTANRCLRSTSTPWGERALSPDTGSWSRTAACAPTHTRSCRVRPPIRCARPRSRHTDATASPCSRRSTGGACRST